MAAVYFQKPPNVSQRNRPIATKKKPLSLGKTRKNNIYLIDT